MPAKWYKCRYPLLIASATAPCALLMGAFQADSSPWLWMLFVVLYAAFGCGCMFLSGKWRLPVGLVGCAALLAAGYQCTPWKEAWPLWFLPLTYAALLLYTLPMGGWERGQELNPAWPICGLGAHLAAQMLISMQQARREVFDALHMPMLLCFLVFLVFCLMMQNRISLLGAMPDSNSVPLSIRRRNRLLVWLMLGLALLLSLIPAFAQALRVLWRWVKQSVLALVRWLMSLNQREAATGSGGGAADMGLMGLEPSEPSLFALIVEKILIAVSVVLAAVIAVWLLRILWKQLKKLGRWLMQRLRSYAQSASEDYVDELEDTRGQGEERFAFARGLFRKRLSERDLKALPPREQIRMRYGMLRRRHPEWTDSQTVRDTLSQSPAQLYERARYSSHEITKTDAEQFLQS